ncbi:ABC transporter, periplasmic substrate-binding protein (fragment) [Cupriavidus taiwanensis]
MLPMPDLLRVGHARADHVEAAVDIGDLTRHAAGQVRQQECGDVADLFDGDIAAQRRGLLEMAEQLAETLDAGSGQGLDRAGRDAVGTDAARADRRGQVAHAGFERGLGQAHGVVVGNHALGAEVSQRQQRGLVRQQRQGGLGQCREAVRGNVVGDAEAFARQAVEEVAGNRFTRREADRMHQAVKLFPALAQRGKGGGNLLVAADVAFENQVAAEFLGKVADPVLEPFADVGEGQFGAFALARRGNAIGDRAVRKQAGDQDPLTCQKSHKFSKVVYQARFVRPPCGRAGAGLSCGPFIAPRRGNVRMAGATPDACKIVSYLARPQNAGPYR